MSEQGLHCGKAATLIQLRFRSLKTIPETINFTKMNFWKFFAVLRGAE